MSQEEYVEFRDVEDCRHISSVPNIEMADRMLFNGLFSWRQLDGKLPPQDPWAELRPRPPG